MNRQELKTLLIAAAQNKAVAEFSREDVQSATANALAEHFGFKDATLRDIRGKQAEVFAIIEEVVDEVVPRMVQDRTSDFAEVRSYPRDASIVYRIPVLEASRRRLYRAIKPGSRGGIYRAYRLEGASVTAATAVETVAYMITLEELLTGTRTIQELVSILTDAWIEKIYVKVFQALLAAAGDAPQINRVVSAAGDEISPTYLDRLIGIVRGYGKPVILGFPQHLQLIANTNSEYFANTDDLADIRNRGYVGMYKGIPLVELPNYIIRHGNTAIEWLFGEETLFILPAGERPVKVAFQGESHTEEVKQPHGGFEYHNHRLMNVLVLFNQHMATYTLDDGWDNWSGGEDDTGEGEGE
jgi:hypothetical protein